MTNFSELAREKAKPGVDIVETMTPEKAHLWHMATGIAGEAGEILDAAINADMENLKEEVGDIRFFMAGLTNGLEWPDAEADARANHSLQTCAIEVVLLASSILDLVKKHCVYNKQLDRAELSIELETLRRVLAKVMQFIPATPAEIYAATEAKLNKRYKGGYSDAEAQARKDKVA